MKNKESHDSYLGNSLIQKCYKLKYLDHQFERRFPTTQFAECKIEEAGWGGAIRLFGITWGLT